MAVVFACDANDGGAVTDDEARAFQADWWGEVWQKGDVGRLDDLVADTYRHHSASGTIVLARDELKTRIVQYQRVLHGAVTTVDAYAISGDLLWQRATSQGVNLETGARSTVTWMVTHRFADGRLVEGWAATVPDVDWRA